jgi:hypothetical protein
MTPTPAPAGLPPLPELPLLRNGQKQIRDITLTELHEYATAYALAAIAAQKQAAVPGWQLVPVQPDSNMMNSAPDAWYSWKSRNNGGSIQQLGVLMWERYLSSAPNPGTEGDLAACGGGGVNVPTWNDVNEAFYEGARYRDREEYSTTNEWQTAADFYTKASIEEAAHEPAAPTGDGA